MSSRMKQARQPGKSSEKQPFVVVNMAMTADGKIATANRKLSSFGSRQDKQHLLELRSTADAVMAGARTIDLNRINMGPGPIKYRRARLKRGLTEYNLRIVVSRTGSVKPGSELFRRRFSPIIILTTSCASMAKRTRLLRLADEIRICGRTQINFHETLRWLRKRWKVKRLVCEGGGEVNDALFRSGLVDELHLTVCPLVFGGQHAPTIADGKGVSSLFKGTKLRLRSARRRGHEMFFVYAAARD